MANGAGYYAVTDVSFQLRQFQIIFRAQESLFSVPGMSHPRFISSNLVAMAQVPS